MENKKSRVLIVDEEDKLDAVLSLSLSYSITIRYRVVNKSFTVNGTILGYQNGSRDVNRHKVGKCDLRKNN